MCSGDSENITLYDDHYLADKEMSNILENISWHPSSWKCGLYWTLLILPSGGKPCLRLSPASWPQTTLNRWRDLNLAVFTLHQSFTRAWWNNQIYSRLSPEIEPFKILLWPGHMRGSSDLVLVQSIIVANLWRSQAVGVGVADPRPGFV